MWVNDIATQIPERLISKVVERKAALMVHKSAKSSVSRVHNPLDIKAGRALSYGHN